MGYIYKITNTINKKCYVGVTTKSNVNDRWASHKSAIKCGNGCPLLMKAFNKYGEDAFVFEIIIICFDDDVFYYENEYIIKYNSLSPNGYNVAEGGKSGKTFLGKKHSEATKKIIGIKSKEYTNRPDVKERARRVCIEWNKTHNVSKLQKKSEKWRKALELGKIGGKGKNRSEEIKNKISNGLKEYFKNNGSANKGKHSKIMTKVNGRKVNQYSKSGDFIASFDSFVLAEKATTIKKGTIQANASGRLKMAGGYIWKYADKII